jgi:hypothetical protein
MAYMTITTTAFLCAAVGSPAPYRRRLRLGAAVLAAGSPLRWTRMLERVRRFADGAIHRLLEASTDFAAGSGPGTKVFGLGVHDSMSSSLAPLIVGTTFALVRALPEEPLTGELPGPQVRRMMIADHLAFGALDRLRHSDTHAMQALATQFQLSALDTATPGVRP